jgi:hypothetical protein
MPRQNVADVPAAAANRRRRRQQNPKMQPPPSSAMQAASRAADGAPRDWFAALPRAVMVSILALLRVEERVRCACVCKAAAAAVADASLWARVDLSAASGLLDVPLTPSALRAVLARARGGLLSLDVSGSLRVAPHPEDEGASDSEADEAEERAAAGLPPAAPTMVTDERLVALLLEAGAEATLQELRVRACEEGMDRFADETADGRRNDDTALLPPAAEALLRALPALRVLDTTMEVKLHDGRMHLSLARAREARAPLRREGVFAPLRVRSLELDFRGTEDAEHVCATVADIGAQGAWLRALKLYTAPLYERGTMDALLDVVVSSRIAHLTLYDCTVGRTSALSLARALRASAALTELHFDKPEHDEFEHTNLWHEESWVAFADALRTHATLRELSLRGLARNGASQRAGTGAGSARLVRALTGHPRLQCLRIAECNGSEPALADAIAALIAENAPALVELDVEHSNLGDAGVSALAAALRCNTHMQGLDISDNWASVACTRDVLMPALRANSSLRRLYATGNYPAREDGCKEAYAEAEELVRLRFEGA